ncbi:MAG: glycerate kinase [Prevotella sp.]|nr:glycerate kinase [Prevotella sp.]
MKIVMAIDSFKGCLSSQQANEAAAEGARAVCSSADVCQLMVSDGGEGFMMAFHAAVGGQLVEVPVRDPLLRPIMARYLLCDELAVVEMAEASGLMLVAEADRNPLVATSYGTGQLIADAIRRGARHIIVGLGGSATSDAGQGMLRALIDALAPHGCWDDVKMPDDVRFTMATDVQNPLCGPLGAAHVYGPQKGATAAVVARLDARAQRFATVSARHFGYDRSTAPGAGAAGGVGYALLQYLDADCRPGIDVLLDTVGYSRLVADADYVITGEGSADRQTLMGKLPMGILRHTPADVPVALIAGRISHRDQLLEAGFAQVECINPPGMPLAEAMRPDVAQANIRLAVGNMIKHNLSIWH